MAFEFDPDKEKANVEKHGVDFSSVEAAFNDPKRIIVRDDAHSTQLEERFYLIGNDGRGILTVRFTKRHGVIRIIGAGYWRKQKQAYEKNNLHG